MTNNTKGRLDRLEKALEQRGPAQPDKMLVAVLYFPDMIDCGDGTYCRTDQGDGSPYDLVRQDQILPLWADVDGSWAYVGLPGRVTARGAKLVNLDIDAEDLRAALEAPEDQTDVQLEMRPAAEFALDVLLADEDRAQLRAALAHASIAGLPITEMADPIVDWLLAALPRLTVRRLVDVCEEMRRQASTWPSASRVFWDVDAWRSIEEKLP